MNINGIKIGGEFEIDPKALTLFPHQKSHDLFLYSSGRSAFLAILNKLALKKAKVIHLPYFICDSIVSTCIKASYKLKYYELTNDYYFPIEYLDSIKPNEILLTVNYFGFTNDNFIINEVKKQRQDIIIISDHVQSFWTVKESNADFCFTSLRKHFPVMDGALVLCKNDRLEADISLTENVFYKNKLLGAIIKNQRINDELYLWFFEKGEAELENESDVTKASLESIFLFKNLDLNRIKETRQLNTNFVYEFGQINGFDFVFPNHKDVKALNVPIYVPNRDKIRKFMADSNVFLPVHWPIGKYNSSSKLSIKNSKHSLSLVMDQRYTVSEIEIELDLLKKALNYVR